MNKNPVDIHCHYFNGKFAFRELLEIGWRRLNNNYPYNRDEKEIILTRTSRSSTVGTLVEYVASLFLTLVRNASENYAYEQICFEKSKADNSQSLITSPLMMDIYFVADNGNFLDKKEFTGKSLKKDSRRAITPLDVAPEDRKRFELFAEGLSKQVVNVVREKKSLNVVRGKRSISKMQPEGIDAGLEDVELALADVITEFRSSAVEEGSADEGKNSLQVTRGFPKQLKKADEEKGLIQLTRGFRKQLKKIQELKRKYPETVFPFFAVDPRRAGVAQLLEENLQDGTFSGVKLYPPLGYFPTHPDLYPIYDLCLQYNVPVTAHCSPGGFHTFCSTVKTKSRDRNGNEETIEVRVAKGYDLSACAESQCHYFADPDNWLEILENEKYKNLRINLAHFGGEEQFLKYVDGQAEKENWTAKIINLIERFDNLSTDISYYTSPGLIPKIEQLLSDHNILEERMMFGTDFVMILQDYPLTGEQDKAFVDYFNHFGGLSERLFSSNALRFLGKIELE